MCTSCDCEYVCMCVHNYVSLKSGYALSERTLRESPIEAQSSSRHFVLVDFPPPRDMLHKQETKHNISGNTLASYLPTDFFPELC